MSEGVLGGCKNSHSHEFMIFWYFSLVKRDTSRTLKGFPDRKWLMMTITRQNQRERKLFQALVFQMMLIGSELTGSQSHSETIW